MEKLPFFKNRRESLASPPAVITVFICFAILICIVGLNTFFTSRNLTIMAESISNAPINPNSASSLAFIFFHPDRQALQDPLTQTEAIANRLDRRVSQYRQLTKSPDLILFPMPSEPDGFKKQPSKELSLWSLQIIPELYTDGFYSLDSSSIGLDVLISRPDLVKITSSPFNRWSQTATTKIFMGSNPNQPKDGQYKIEYYSYVVPKLCILGSVDSSGRILPQKIFIDDPKAPSPKTILLTQIDRFFNSVLSLNIITISVLLLILLREISSPKDSHSFYQKIAKITRYDLLLSPLVLLVPQTQRSAMLFSIAILSYITFKIFLKKSVFLIQRERINLYR